MFTVEVRIPLAAVETVGEGTVPCTKTSGETDRRACRRRRRCCPSRKPLPPLRPLRRPSRPCSRQGGRTATAEWRQSEMDPRREGFPRTGSRRDVRWDRLSPACATSPGDFETTPENAEMPFISSSTGTGGGELFGLLLCHLPARFGCPVARRSVAGDKCDFKSLRARFQLGTPGNFLICATAGGGPARDWT